MEWTGHCLRSFFIEVLVCRMNLFYSLGIFCIVISQIQTMEWTGMKPEAMEQRGTEPAETKRKKSRQKAY